MNIGRSPTASKYSYSLLHIAIKKGEKTHTVYLSKKKALSFFERASERRLGVFALSPLFTFRHPELLMRCYSHIGHIRYAEIWKGSGNCAPWKYSYNGHFL